MMKKAFLLVLGVCWSAISFASDFKEGEHYERVPGLTPTKGKVVEFFSYSCPACNSMERYLKPVIQGAGKDYKFEKVPVGNSASDSWQMSQKLHVATKLLKLPVEFHEKVFSRIHESRRHFKDEQDIIDFLVHHGVDEKKAKRAVTSFHNQKGIKKANERADKARVSKVPTIIVNNKYKILGVRSPDEMKELVDHLLKL